MTLQEVRDKTIELSGRFDLAALDASGQPKVDYFLKAGLGFIDRALEYPKMRGVHRVQVPRGEHKVEVDAFRAIERVIVTDALNVAYELDRLELEDFQERFGVPPYPASLSALPTHYALGIMRGTPGTPNRYEARRLILFSATLDQDYDVTVIGRYESSFVYTDENSANYWSLRHPDVLIAAARMKMEETYRNSQGANDHRNAVLQMLRLLDFDVVAEDIAIGNQMKNSW